MGRNKNLFYLFSCEFQMGGGESKLKDLKIEHNNWEKVESNSQFDVMRSKEGKEAQQYHFVLDQTMNIDKQVDNYIYRANTQGNHVKVIGVQSISNSIGLCGKSNTVNVLTQRIPILLANSRQLNQQQSNIVLYNAAKGLSQLTSKYGNFQLTDKMIGFTPLGETKVWVNQNFGKNSPEIYYKQLKSDTHLTEQNMVTSLIKIIESKTERGHFNQPYRKNLYSRENFGDVVREISKSGISIQSLEQNRVNIFREGVIGNNLVIERPVNNQPLPYFPNPNSKPSNTRVSFNYISPGISR